MFALIPAAGKSERMGRPKLALPLGDRSVLECVVEAVRAGGVEHVLVVVGPLVPELAGLARQAGAHVLELDVQTSDMRSTIERGLRWLEERFHPKPANDWLLLPADHPTLDAAIVRQLVEARQQHPECSIALPTHEGRRGHPTLISWRHVSGIRALPAGKGLNVYLRQHQSETLEVPVESPQVLCDLDTPEDYERLRQERS